jgi:hypothetical protein
MQMQQRGIRYNMIIRMALALGLLIPLAGCVFMKKHPAGQAPSGMTSRAPQERIIIKSAGLSIEAWDLPAAVDKVSAIVQDAGGYIENSNFGESSIIFIESAN